MLDKHYKSKEVLVTLVYTIVMLAIIFSNEGVPFTIEREAEGMKMEQCASFAESWKKQLKDAFSDTDLEIRVNCFLRVSAII